jgi:hypothetical protein
VGSYSRLFGKAIERKARPARSKNGNLRRCLKAANLPLAGVHILRHSAAKLRWDAGESIENVSAFSTTRLCR